MNRQKRYYKYFLLLMIPLVFFGALGSLIFQKSYMIHALQSQNEQLQEKYANTVAQAEESITYQEGLNKEFTELIEVNQKLQEDIESLKNESADETQAFHGDWWINSFYTSDVDEKQEYEGYGHRICFRNYIFMTDDHITDEPIYEAVICDRDKIMTELSDIGIDDTELIGMLESDYYEEMDFSETYHWNRHFFPGEVDFIQQAKYYPINLDTMLCITRNDGGKVYVLKRHLTPPGRK